MSGQYTKTFSKIVAGADDEHKTFYQGFVMGGNSEMSHVRDKQLQLNSDLWALSQNNTV